jgi:hypothetical protein
MGGRRIPKTNGICLTLLVDLAGIGLHMEVFDESSFVGEI